MKTTTQTKPKPSDTVATERTTAVSAVNSSDMVRCNGCGNEIDEDVCWCGDLMKAHDAYCGHNPVPMGCDCGRCKLPDDLTLNA